jgi:putative glutamine amidotransferase
MSAAVPVVGIVCDHRMIGPHPFHAVGEKYITAVRDGAQTLPLLIPSLDPAIPPTEILSAVDGLFFTGSPSNVAPARYNGEAPREGTWLDEKRDDTALPLLKTAIEKGVPTFCVCRGFQELNVVMGGTLYQHVQEVPGRMDHREDKKTELDVQYGPAHDVRVGDGGLLSKLLPEKTFRVNSLHSQGIDRLAPSLFAEATAPDGLVEAVSMPGARGFLLAVQWHPEWKWRDNPVSRALFGAFGAAIRESTRA